MRSAGSFRFSRHGLVHDRPAGDPAQSTRFSREEPACAPGTLELPIEPGVSNGVQKGPPIGVEEGPPFQII